MDFISDLPPAPDYTDKFSISFGDAKRDFDVLSIEWINTWTRWHLVPAKRPDVNPPPAVTEYITIPNRNGVIDITDELESGVFYGSRTGSWDFYVMHEYNASWYTVYNDILETIHGQQLRIRFENDPNWYYIGRVYVNKWKSDPHRSKITLDYELDPDKYSINTTGDFDWLFDDAVQNRRKDLITSTFKVNKKKYRDFVYNGTKPARPVIDVPNANFQVKFKGRTIQLKEGKQAYGDLRLSNGHNHMIFYGTGIIKFYVNLGASL